MKFARICAVMMVLQSASLAFAKEAAPSAIRKPVEDVVKAEPSLVPTDAEWKRYLRWHRDATALRGRDEGLNGNGRLPSLQL
jgi:hypothetical protein